PSSPEHLKWRCGGYRPARALSPSAYMGFLPENQVRTRLPTGANGIRTCMGLFLSSSRFWFVAGSLFGAGKPFFVPSPAIRFAERAEGVKGSKRQQRLAAFRLAARVLRSALTSEHAERC